jgi:PAS domain S-box-containing protein
MSELMLAIKKSSVERLMLIGFGLTLAVLLLVGGIAWNIAVPMAPFKSVDHTREVMAAIDELRSHTDRAENRQWAYFLTKEKSFLVQRDTALAAVKPTIAQLFALTLDNDPQHERMVKLEAAADKRIRILLENQAVFDNQGMGGTLGLFDASISASESMLGLMAEAQQREQDLLEMRKASETSRLRIIVASIFLLLVFLALLTVRIRRAIRSRLQDEQEAQEVRETLLKTGALQDAIFNSANFSSIATDAQGVIQIFNVGAERMLGYKADEVVDKITPAGISDGQELIARAAALSHELDTPITPGFEALVFKASRGIEDIYELTYIRKDGSRFPAIVSVTALRDDQEKVIGYLLIGTDNTARKEAEAALLRAGALQNAIFNSANFSSIATDAQGVIQIFNVGAERMLGYKADEVVDKITPAGISDAQELVARAAALSFEFDTPITPGFEALVFKASRGIEDIYELTYIRKDGSRFPAIVSVTALRDEQENVIGYLLIGTDNTARKQVEAEQALLDQRLRDQQFYARSLIESNIDAIITTDPRGIINDVNQQMQELTGCTRDELIGAPFKKFFTDPQRAEEAITRALREGKVTNYELTSHARDGTETVVSYNATTFHDRDRKLQGVFASARDITEAKQLQQKLQKNNIELEVATTAAESANRAKSDFLSSMSHELRTPLNAILGFAQLVESGTPAPTPAQKRNIDQILKAGWYLLELINEILDLALIESGRLTLSSEPVSMVEVMFECRAMIEPQAQKRGVGMTFPRFDVPYFVSADRTRVKQILINLLFNAIKYNKTGGSVAVEYTLSPSDSIRVSVRDTGLGLAPEQLAQLFQPFNRLGKETSAEEGTGIGLVVTKRLVELMGGTIGADSKVGVGSVFWFELPLTTALQIDSMEADDAALVKLPLPASTTRHTLLYVEDNPANLELVEQLVARRSDVHLLSAADGNVGIEFARAYQPEVILMDINLPGISGIDAMKILRADPLTAHIPIIAVSANAVPGDIEKGLNAGFFSYITKPIKVNQFMDTLNEALVFSQTSAGKDAEEEIT